MYAYCLNNPILYRDETGHSAALPPMVENGLNLPSSGGWPVEIDGTIYYYATDIQNGQLYEYWFDVDGNLVWARHHSDHKQPHKHEDPHDHKGGKGKGGKNTLVGGPQEVNEKFQPPKRFSYADNPNDNTLDSVKSGVVTGIIVYHVAKWVAATLLAPLTGGGSYVMVIA